jgi:hypothetical protein
LNLKDIKSKPGPNPGGTVRLWLVPWQDVLAIPDPDPLTGIIVAGITLKTGKKFHRFEFAPGRCRLSNPTAGSDGSHWFDTVLDLVVPGDNQELMNLFQSMLNGLCLALTDQATGTIKLCGTIASPLMCKISHDHGQDTNDFNGATIQLRSRGFLPVQYTAPVQTYEVLWRVRESSAYCVTEGGE